MTKQPNDPQWITNQYICQKHLAVAGPQSRVSQFYVDVSASSCGTHTVRYRCTCRAKKGWVYLASLPFDVPHHHHPPPLLSSPSLSLSHSLSLLYCYCFADKKCFPLPEEWKYLQGHCKHSKQGTTPLSGPWLSAGTEILGCYKAVTMLLYRRKQGIYTQNVMHIESLSCASIGYTEHLSLLFDMQHCSACGFISRNILKIEKKGSN